MLFNSIEFLIFFPIVVTAYFALPYGLRWMVLLGASYAFYMAWNPAYIFLIFVSTAVDYVAAIRMTKLPEKEGRGKWLTFSIAANLGLLFSFKYFNFFGEAFRHFVGLADISVSIPHFNVLLPVGISFYTFQTLSYTIEVYRGNQNPERHLGRFALYVAFFPQLVAGPIERPGRLLPQLEGKYDFDYGRVVEGLRLMLWGMFKKVVIADRLAMVVDSVYATPERYPGSFLVIATVFFAFQIYCDFSGYTDIAIGAARIFGIKLMNNFDRPYFATSIQDFWRRWHISLSTWFRDYVYLPLGGNRTGKARWQANLFIVFILSGLWHGANWTFIAWGTFHAVLYIVGNATGTLRTAAARTLRLTRAPRVHHLVKVVTTFAWVTLAWVFFRADSIGDALYVFLHLHEGWIDLSAYGGFSRLVTSMDITVLSLAITSALIPFLLVAEQIPHDGRVASFVGGFPVWARWSAYVVAAFAIMNLGVTQEIPFVYFQF